MPGEFAPDSTHLARTAIEERTFPCLRDILAQRSPRVHRSDHDPLLPLGHSCGRVELPCQKEAPLESPNPYTIFGIQYCQEEQYWYACVQALDELQAVEVLWQAILETSDPCDPSLDTIDVERIDSLTESVNLPFPEVAPKGPGILAVLRLGRNEDDPPLLAQEGPSRPGL
jgi:hypothetical protein